MNIRKPVDYSAMFASLDMLMTKGLTQMELYREIGGLVSSRPGKGAAVTAAEYLQSICPDAAGFSPRNLHRMREFYRTYENVPETMSMAMRIKWTQNTVIIEAELAAQEKLWYIQAVHQYGWSKIELLRQIKSSAHLNLPLDLSDEACYTEESAAIEEVPGHAEAKDYQCDGVGGSGTAVACFPKVWQVHPLREGNTRTVVMMMTMLVEHCGYYMDHELLAASAGYVRDASVMALLDQFSEPEHLERILLDTVCTKPVEYSIESLEQAEA